MTGTFLDDLRDDLVRASRELSTNGAVAEGRPAVAGRRSRVRRFVRVGRFAPLVAVFVIGTTVALAANGVISIPIGKPVKLHVNTDPHAGLGVLVPGTAKILALRTPDPAGGPPWGLRILRTTRGAGCVQAGRIVNGRFGVLGQDGLYGDDGRFHALPAVPGATGCTPIDTSGRLYANVTTAALGAGGLGDPNTIPCQRPAPRSVARCKADLRVLSYGVLGPRARTITYTTAAGKPHTIRATQPYGAYLIVERQPANHGFGFAFGQASATPVLAPTTKITFAGARPCTFDRPGRCTIPGHVAPTAPRYTPEQLATPIHARIAKGTRYPEIVLTFRAPVPVTSAVTAYAGMVRFRTPNNGFTHSSAVTQHDLRKGQLVTLRLYYPGHSGRVTGDVRYGTGRFWNPKTMAALVGRYSLDVP
jgi:hypothetical protein